MNTTNTIQKYKKEKQMIKTTTLLQITGAVFLYTAFTVGIVAATQPLGIGAGLIILLGHLGLLK